ncbi:hypothetical protein AC578_445 [Pseudocercospora eumusae]|uniref:Uncharacterized protein n=1 Tax=Pseudocercospora eumusae TaxID=321146 RepID=A0A139HXU9_9PEZI|nr:hypothetical protein AC578_445 [Pseudocercospora eumusae]
MASHSSTLLVFSVMADFQTSHCRQEGQLFFVIFHNKNAILTARKHIFHLPRLWRDVGAALTSDNLFNDDVLRGLEKRRRSVHADFLAWLEEYKCHCVARSLIQPTQLEIDLRRETFGVVLECMLITKRLITSVSDSDRLKMECETQAMAKLIMDLQDQPMPKNSCLFAAHEIGVAQV